ncbi:type 1 glutamine amidotransferase [Nitrosomonas communis]|uniref:GMP synthase-Glutamine amidotransferase n=1 Tax=Nitrosomonas communis TaxID=44574 RepID=A0A1I4JNH5_9PROT|nr:type 1 glutamine amidotransferase [Nitrosomonas communis]SFL68148.1 GMP synthase-Glutamine amidotransferase [Nitrosomonas communis]
MKPIAIFRFSPIEGPGYFATFLDNNHIPWQLISIDQGEGLPGNIHLFSGLVLMGGPMSVNDNLPWIGSLLALIKQAVAHDVPVLGHCLGGQLMSKAFGGIIEANPIKELGWGKVRVADNPVAHEWLGDLKEFEPFHWHGETFSLPAGSALLLSNAYCQNQAFALGIHLGMQCHVEMTEDMVLNWSRVNAAEIIQNQASPAVQPADAMQTNLKSRVSKLNMIADQLYRKWITALKTGE